MSRLAYTSEFFGGTKRILILDTPDYWEVLLKNYATPDAKPKELMMYYKSMWSLRDVIDQMLLRQRQYLAGNFDDGSI